jgi:hypothetical protein
VCVLAASLNLFFFSPTKSAKKTFICKNFKLCNSITRKNHHELEKGESYQEPSHGRQKWKPKKGQKTCSP